MPTRPTIVCLCGSTRFYEDFVRINQEQTLLGKIVLSVGCFMHRPEIAGTTPLTFQQKFQLDRLHLQKIDMADEVFVINRDGYVGESTRKEIIHAVKMSKNIHFLVEPTTAEFSALRAVNPSRAVISVRK